jgi:ABC-type transport system substrate-binding protein
VADDAGDMQLLHIVKDYFAQIGIDMEIRPMESTAWMAFVLNGHKHDQLAQRPVSPFGHCFRTDPAAAALENRNSIKLSDGQRPGF